MSGLSTHILDTANGRPASGVRVELFALGEDGSRKLLKTAVTNADGRPDALLIEAQDMAVGCYELVFHVGDYFQRTGNRVADPPFLQEVPVRFAIADLTTHYHVPLLAAPWGYTTYRGS